MSNKIPFNIDRAKRGDAVVTREGETPTDIKITDKDITGHIDDFGLTHWDFNGKHVFDVNFCGMTNCPYDLFMAEPEEVKENSLFKKVMVSDRLPQDGNKHIFHLNSPVASVDEGQKHYDECYTIDKGQIGSVKHKCDWWLEEVESTPVYQLPTDDGFIKKMMIEFNKYEFYVYYPETVKKIIEAINKNLPANPLQKELDEAKAAIGRFQKALSKRLDVEMLLVEANQKIDKLTAELQTLKQDNKGLVELLQKEKSAELTLKQPSEFERGEEVEVSEYEPGPNKYWKPATYDHFDNGVFYCKLSQAGRLKPFNYCRKVEKEKPETFEEAYDRIVNHPILSAESKLYELNKLMQKKPN